MNVGHKIIIIKVNIVEDLPTVFIPAAVIPEAVIKYLQRLYAYRGCVGLKRLYMPE